MASFEKRGKSWRYQISHSRNGQKQRISKSGFKTKKEAQVAAAEVETKLNKGLTISTEDPLLSDYVRDWIDMYKIGNVQKVTETKYRSFINAIEQGLPFKTVKMLTKREYQAFLNEFGKTHAKDTIRKLNGLIRACVREAIEEGIIYADPTRDAVIKAGVSDKSKDEKFLNVHELKALIHAIKSKDALAVSDVFILVMAATGMRYAECAGLTWNCVDFHKGKIKIEKAWHYRSGEYKLGPLKNDESERVISVDASTLNLLKEFKLRSGSNVQSLIFYQLKYGVLSNNGLNKALRLHCERTGIQTITSHALRHTHASALLYKRIPIHYVSKRLGHADIATTLKNYTHVLKELEQEADVETLEILDSLQNN
jgi:integrase